MVFGLPGFFIFGNFGSGGNSSKSLLYPGCTYCGSQEAKGR